MKTTHYIIAFAAAILATAASAKWDIVTSTDPMTDETQYTIGTFGDKYEINSLLSSTPSLVVRLHPKALDKTGKLLGTQKVILILESDRIHRNGATLLVRFDKEPPEKWELSAATDRVAGFIENPSAFIQRLKKSNEVRIRLETSLGAIRTLRFSTAGLAAELEKVHTQARAQMAKTMPKT
jgi:hypothetical protein